ncbi:MAG: glycerol-3-phosphate dehydrogenase [Thermoplasmata archaeon]|nr:glycerol-3-phosphate dehydrogenase [Thermoplasmata archaeon]
MAAPTFDLLVVGGGINGAAIARDAALRGLSVCIVEMDDWGGGTSAKSSKLAHGGLRYLEQLEFGLVHEALSERERLLKHAPHLVKPLRFLYPLYPHIAARRTVRMGLWLYDVLSPRKSLPRRKYLRRADALAEAPGLNPAGLAGASVFYDAQIQHVGRLVAEMVADARAHGAVARNHTRVEYLLFEHTEGRRRVQGAVVQPESGPQEHILARAVVNAAGCWVDDVLGPLAEGHPPKVRKTKGIHVVVPAFTPTAVLARGARDGRTMFILPWQGQCILGTTDTDFEGDPRDAVANAEEVAYLAAEARRYFPDAPVEEVRYTYAGVRALVNQPGVTESNVTRRHVLYEHAARDGVDGLWTLQGGKITTARALAEECVDRIAASLGHKARLEHPTRKRPYPGGPPGDWDEFEPVALREAAAAGLDAAAARHLVGLYGARWRDVLESDDRPEARQRLHPAFPDLACQATYAVRREQAAHLGDVLLRRTMLGLGPRGNPDAARAVLAWMAGLLGWDAARQEEEWLRYQHEARALVMASAPAGRTTLA